jgi:hypothetical protein
MLRIHPFPPNSLHATAESHVEPLGKLRQSPIALDGSKRHLRFLPIRRHQRARHYAETPPIVLSNFPEQALYFMA